MKKTFMNIYMGVIFIFLYAPIIVVILFSFNELKSRTVFDGFTLKWYFELFKDDFIIKSLLNSIVLALLSSILATIMGVAAALRIAKMKKFGRSFVMNFTNIPLVNSEVVTGVSLMMLFTLVLGFFGKGLGFATVLIAHITFCTPYVILNILPKLKQTDPNLLDAALDLGCTNFQAFFKVVLPQITSSVIASFVMAFSLSFDDFAVSYFTTGSGFQTLPIAIYSMTRRRITPKINALFTMLFALVFILLIFKNVYEFMYEKKVKNNVK